MIGNALIAAFGYVATTVMLGGPAWAGFGVAYLAFGICTAIDLLTGRRP